MSVEDQRGLPRLDSAEHFDSAYRHCTGYLAQQIEKIELSKHQLFKQMLGQDKIITPKIIVSNN